MGKWNYRRRWTPKNYYRDQRLPTPPSYYQTEFKLRGAWKNVELPWEERFCISVGIPWEKVVTAKKYMHCHENVVKWNDSAGEETFFDAKKRFWDKINGVPSDVPPPDPDIYINEIDWNPEIDPELVKELDQAYFNPDEAEKVENFDVITKTGDSLFPGVSSGFNDKNITISDNPWERKTKANLYNKNVSNPWEQGTTQADRETKDIIWGGCANKSRDKDITWGGGGGNSSWDTDMAWGGGASNSWHWNQLRAQKVDNNSKNTWACGGGTAGYVQETGWGNNRNICGLNGWDSRGTQPNGAPRSGQRGRGRGNSFVSERWRGQHDNQRQHENGWESRKRECSQQYTSSYKSARVQSDDYGTGNEWRGQRGQNRVSFALE